MGLISPPPHHDIYSIEDLAQLIHDLKVHGYASSCFYNMLVVRYAFCSILFFGLGFNYFHDFI